MNLNFINPTKALLIITVVSAILISSCKKENTSTAVSMDMVDSAAALKFRGQFINGPYGNVNGTAKIYTNGSRYDLVLDSFMTSNGPDLHVYLSKEIPPVQFIDLGLLKTTRGKQVYEISGMPSFLEYRYALVHCRQYNHLFGSAILQ